MALIPTVLTTIKGAEIIINASDYDPNVYGPILVKNPGRLDEEVVKAAATKPSGTMEKASQEPMAPSEAGASSGVVEETEGAGDAELFKGRRGRSLKVRPEQEPAG